MQTPVYHTMIMVRVGDQQKQRSVFAATPTQKRACELFDVTQRHMSEYGGTGGSKAVLAMCRAEPDVVFVELSNDTYIRLADWEDPSKEFKIDVKDEDLYGRDTQHPAFGMVHAQRVSGQRDLFQVDYPQDHWVELVIESATLNRNNAHDRVHGNHELMRIAMSSVQWAGLLTSMNTQGVPCTLSRYTDPFTGDFLMPKLPPKHVADTQTFTDEIEERARKSVEGVRMASARLDEIMKGPLRKGDLAEVQELLRAAQGAMESGVTYTVEMAAEKINDAAEHAKAEVNAHIDFSMMRLGERALGARLQDAIDSGADIKAIGYSVSNALDAPAGEE